MMTIFNNRFFAVATTALVLASKDVSAASSPTETARKQLEQALEEWKLNRSRGRNLLEASSTTVHRQLNFTECLSEREAMFNASPALQLADDKVYDEYIDLEEETCGDNPSLCIIDEGNLASVPLLKQACEDNNGVLYEWNLTMECRLTTVATGESETVQYQYLNSPECLPPKSCKAADVAAALEQVGDEELDFLQESLTVEGVVTVECESDVTAKTSDAFIMVTGTMVSFGAAVCSLLVAGLFFM